MEYQDISHLLGSPSSLFMGAIIEVYRDDNKLFGFTCYREVGQLRVFNARPIYKSYKDALREAKKYCFLLSIATDTKNNAIACDLTSSKIVAQTKPAIKLLGDVNGLEAKELFIQDWNLICQQAEELRCYEKKVRLRGLDGQEIKTDVNFEFIKIDTLGFIVSRWGEVHRSP